MTRMVAPYRALVVAIFVGFVLTMSVATGARAQDIPTLQGQITDLTRSQVLGNGRGQIESALRELQQNQDIQLWVLFLESTGGRTVTEFADEVARRNSLGANDALLVVALSDRTDALWRSSTLGDRLTDQELGQVLSRRVEPRLQQGDFPAAVVEATRGLRDVAGGGQTSAGEAPGSGIPFGPILLIGLLGAGGAWLWSIISRRRDERRAAEERDRKTGMLAREANALLIRTDEALRTAQEEIGFAEAQFSPEDVAPYRDAVARASEDLKAAFTVRQQLDDDVPEDPETRRKLLAEIVERARRAQALLDEQRKRIEELRDLERNAPQILAALPAQLDALQARAPEAEETLNSLESYADRVRQAVRGNIPEAGKRVGYARTQVEAGRRALESGDAAAAARSARSAQHALEEATQLINAIDALAKSVREAQQAVGPQISTAETDLATAHAAMNGTGTPEQRTRLAEAERELQQARSELATDRPDVLTAFRLATNAEAVADSVLAEVRQETERRQKEAQVLAAQLQVADASYRRSADFIATRRGGIGRTARTRLAEAGRSLEDARMLARADPRAALAEAQRAERLAEEAYDLARDDFDDYDSYGRRGSSFPIPFPVIIGGGWGGGGGGWGGGSWGSGGGWGGGGSVGGGWGGGGGGSVGGRW
jgi:hypothetical protein